MPAASTSGWSAVEPAAVMVPVSQATAAALPLAAGAEPLASADAAVVGAAAEAAVVGDALEPELEHAANANAATKAKAARRFGVGMVTRGSSCSAARHGARRLAAARLGLDRGPLCTPAGVSACLILTGPPSMAGGQRVVGASLTID